MEERTGQGEQTGEEGEQAQDEVGGSYSSTQRMD